MRILRLLCVLALAAVPALAQAPAAQVQLELNRVEDAGPSCRIYMVVNNTSEIDFASFVVDLVVFDADGIIQRRLAFDAAPLPPKRTRVKLFDLERLTCAQVARFHFNDVVECRDQAAKRDCAALVQPISRAARTRFTQ